MAKKTKLETTPNTEKKQRSNPYFNLDEEKAFFEEVDEEVRNEKFKNLINKYGGVILFVLILALSIVVGYEKIGQWRIQKAQQRNVQYIQALTSNPNYENNITELENIVNSEKGLYRDMARLQIANILLDNGKQEKALNLLQQLIDDDKAIDKIKEIAAIKLATYKIDSAPYASIEALLSNIVNNKNSSWKDMAEELLAMSAIQNKDYEKAKSIYQELLKNSRISDEFRARINDMLTSINDAQK
ncbi:MAG: tetratricopeptide repeat protein [Alphaproteobacteria bacterium]|nr:tetratricopeptide repeat protein [Alphaproteobacteria bacterium]